MTTLICFIIAMTILYFIELSDGGFNIDDLMAYLIAVVILGLHTYLCTRKSVIWGAVVPILVLASFYPVYRLIEPTGSSLFMLICLYAIILVLCLYLWRDIRKKKSKED